MVAAQAARRLGVRLFIGEAALDALEVVLALARLALGGVDAAVGRLVVQPRRGDLDAGVDLVVEAEVFVDVRRGDLAGRDGADDGRRAGDAVAAGEDAVHIVDLAAGLGDERAALDGDLRLLKAVGLHALTDGDNDNVRRDALFAALGLFGRGAALLIHLADDLRLCPQCATA